MRWKPFLRRKASAKDIVYYKDVRGAVGRELEVWQYRELLDPIYTMVRVQQGRPALTAIVITDENEPHFFSDGGATRSMRFNPKRHMSRWVNEVKRVHAERR